jgi:hypothetical protein
MAKHVGLRPDDPNALYEAVIAHMGAIENDDYFGHYHAIWVYTQPEGCPACSGYQWYPTWDQAMCMARKLVARPQMAADRCTFCRGYRDGPHVVRWNIYRGECHLPRWFEGAEHAIKAPPACFLLHYLDPPPPGWYL